VSGHYNPIVRNFGRLRAALVSALDLDRHEVRPSTPLAALLPVERRRELWRQMRLQGVPLPGLRLTRPACRWYTLAVVTTVLAFALWLQKWSALLLATSLGQFAYKLSRRHAVYFPLGLGTVGELVLYMTSFREHKSSGYRPTHNEIAFKVRQIIAECVGVPLDAVQPETNLNQLDAL
jgi:hypothetical protein